jgi:hypothetical protein
MDRVACHLFDVCAYAIRTMPECVSVYQWGNTLTVLEESPRLLGTVALGLARCCCYLATPFRPFGEPGSGVFKYGKIGK